MADPWGYLDSQPAPDVTADPWGYLDLDGQVRRAALRHGVDPGLLGAMVHQESAGDPAAVSPKGATGLLQVLPDTARGLGYRPEDMADPEKNLDAGAAYMGQMLQRYGGDRALALAAYNAGPGAVDKHGGVPPYQETQAYVRQVQAKAGPPADPWGYLGAPAAAPTAPNEKPPAPAQRAPGNIDLKNRPRVVNPDGSVSTVRSISIGTDRGEVLIPTVSDEGRLLSNAAAVALYKQTGRHLGIFDSPAAATSYAKQLHADQAALLANEEWGPTGSPLLQKRRRPDGSYETRPTPRPGQDSAVGSVPAPETGILPTIGAQFGLAGAELQAGLAGVADLPRKAMNYLATPAQLAASVPQNPFYHPVAYGDQGDPVALAPHPGVDVLNYEPVQYPGAVEDVRQAIAEKPEEARQRLAEASSTLPTPIAVAAHQQAMVLAGVADPLNWLLPGGGEERAAAHGVEDVILRQAVEPHNAEELALLARRARVMPTVPGAEAPFVAPGAVADSLRPEGRILGIGEHATEADQLQHLGMRAAPEDARALERVSAGIGEPGWVPPEPPPDPWGYLGKPAELDQIRPALAKVSPGPPLVRIPPSDEVAILPSPPLPPVGSAQTSKLSGMTVYHGSPRTDLTVLQEGHPQQFDNATSELGTFFAPTEQEAQRYAGATGRVYSTDLRLANPKAMNWKDFGYFQDPMHGPLDADGFRGPTLPPEQWPARATELRTEARALRGQLEAAGHDGVVVHDRAGNPVEISSFRDVALSPEPAPLAAAVSDLQRSPEISRGLHGDPPPRLLTMEDVLPPAEERPPPASVGASSGVEKEAQHLASASPRATSLTSLSEPPGNIPENIPALPEGLTTGTTHAITRAERNAAGLPEVERLAARESPSWEEAKAIYNDNPESARILAEHVRKNPRQLTDVENDVLLHDRMSLTLDYREALAKEQAALQGDDTTAAALATANRQAIEAAHTANTEALDKAGTVWGRAGQARQKLAAEDYSAINLNARYAVANGGEEAPAAVRQKLADLSSQLEAAQARVAAAEDRAQQLEAQRLIAAEQRQAGSAARSGKRAASKAQLDAEYKDLGAQLRKATHVQANLSPEQVRILAQQARNRVRSGITNLSELVDTLHADASPYIADLEPRDVRDVIAGVGQGTTRTRSELSGNLARLKSQAKLLNKLDDVYAGQGLPAAAKRAAPSPEVAALREKLGQVTEDLKLRSALTDQQRLGRIKSALETKIERVERGILPAKLPAVSSPEVDALRKTLEQRLEDEGVIVGHDSRVRMALENAQERLKSPGLDPQTRELLKGEVDRWTAEAANPATGRGPLTEAERLAGAKSRTASRIADLEAQIKAREFPSRGRAPAPADEALLKARGELAGLRHQADRIIAAREAANRTGFEKAMDWTAGWGRFLKLSGLFVTPQKLVGAVGARTFLIRPLEELTGAGVSKLPLIEHFAAEAPVEGGGSLSAIAKSFGAFFGRQAREEAMGVLKTGNGPLDLAFGEFHDHPELPDWMGYPGRGHGAIKAPGKIAAYQFAMEKQAKGLLRSGEGDLLLNPLKQEEMKGVAKAYANSEIYMGKHRLVEKFNNAVRDDIGDTAIAKGFKTAVRTELPIVKVATNYATDLSHYAVGAPKAALRMGRVVSRGRAALGEEAAGNLGGVVREGLKHVPRGEADEIMRQLKKGIVGPALLGLSAAGIIKAGGYYHPGEHRRPDDLQPGEISVAGHHLPHMLLHQGALEIMQSGGSIHRQRQIADGLKDSLFGSLETVPFYEEALKVRNIRDNPLKPVGDWERGMTIPPDVQRLARVMDQRGQPGAGEKFLQELGWLHIDANRRKPHGGPLDRLWKEEELGLPGLRQGVR